MLEIFLSNHVKMWEVLILPGVQKADISVAPTRQSTSNNFWSPPGNQVVIVNYELPLHEFSCEMLLRLNVGSHGENLHLMMQGHCADCHLGFLNEVHR